MQLQLDNNKKELKSHGTYAFPVNVSYEQLSRYERKSFLWHWHKEIELTILLQGEMQYQVNDTIYHLQAGEGLFCNSNRLHTGSSCHDSDCIYISTTFHPRFLYGYEDSVIQNKYLNTITKHPGLHSLLRFPGKRKCWMNCLPSGCFPNSPPPLMRWNCNGDSPISGCFYGTTFPIRQAVPETVNLSIPIV